MTICGLSQHQGATESRKNLEEKFIFQIGTLNPHGINERFSFNVSVKDRTPVALKSMVVYQFSCAGCNSRYIGETSCHFSTRIKEHTKSDKNSHIFTHFNTPPLCKTELTE